MGFYLNKPSSKLLIHRHRRNHVVSNALGGQKKAEGGRQGKGHQNKMVTRTLGPAQGVKNEGFPDLPNLNDFLPKSSELSSNSTVKKLSNVEAKRQYREQHEAAYTAKLPNRYTSLHYGQQW